jgi:cellulose synthase (UDP-forming)
VALNATLPLVYLCAGLTPLEGADVAVMVAFLPYILAITWLLKEMSGSHFRFSGICLSLASFPIYIKALLHLLLGLKPRFVITPKCSRPETCWLLILPLGAYVICACTGTFACFLREGLSPALVANGAWALFYIATFSPVLVAGWQDRADWGSSWLRQSSPSLNQTSDLSRSVVEP